MKSIIKYMAKKVQLPGKKNKVAIVLLSKEGAGKNVIVDKFGEVLGLSNYTMVSSPESVFGSFNGILEQCLLLCVNEAGCLGSDSTIKGKLKSLVTDDTIMINEKFVPQYKVDNMLDMFILSNNDSVIHTERRTFTLELDNKYAGPSTGESHKYFEEIRRVKPLHLHHYFSGVSIDGFNPMDYPRNSEAALNQMIEGMTHIESWLHSKLDQNSGRIHFLVSDKVTVQTDVVRWLKTKPDVKYVLKEAIYSSYIADSVRPSKNKAENSFWVSMIKVFGKFTEKKLEGRKKMNEQRKACVLVPDIKEMRSRFEQYKGISCFTKGDLDNMSDGDDNKNVDNTDNDIDSDDDSD